MAAVEHLALREAPARAVLLCDHVDPQLLVVRDARLEEAVGVPVGHHVEDERARRHEQRHRHSRAVHADRNVRRREESQLLGDRQVRLGHNGRDAKRSGAAVALARGTEAQRQGAQLQLERIDVADVARMAALGAAPEDGDCERPCRPRSGAHARRRQPRRE